jgi:hypothetical protein
MFNRFLTEAAARVLAAAFSLVSGWGADAPSLKPLGEVLQLARSLGLTCSRSIYLAVC